MIANSIFENVKTPHSLLQIYKGVARNVIGEEEQSLIKRPFHPQFKLSFETNIFVSCEQEESHHPTFCSPWLRPSKYKKIVFNNTSIWLQLTNRIHKYFGLFSVSRS